jgi:rhomboid protease GluP
MAQVLIPLLVVTSMTVVLLRQQDPSRRPRVPWVTLALFVVTLAVGAFAVFDDALLDAIRRDLGALRAGEWWRLITPLFGQDGGLSGLIFNLVILLAVGAVVENMFGWRLLLITYFSAGLLSEIAAYTVMLGQGFAGNSVANFGLVGLICAFGVLSGSGARLTGALGLIGGVVLLVIWDLHGIGFAVGALIGLAIGLVRWLRQRPKARASTSASSAAPGAPGASSAGS